MDDFMKIVLSNFVKLTLGVGHGGSFFFVLGVGYYTKQ